MIRPGLIAGAIFAFITSFDEVVVARFMSGSAIETLPIKMWTGIRFEINPVVASASTILIVLSAVVLAIAAALRKRA
jgi:putative spermidine/putrescine transport system permease protein